MTDKVSLYGITETLKGLEKAIAEAGGEVTEETEAMLEQISVELSQKTDGVVGWVQSQEDFVEAIEKRIGELVDLKAKTKKSLENFNNYVLTCMDRMGVTKIEGDFSVVNIPKPRSVVEIIDENSLPLDYIKTETKKITKVDKKAIGDSLKKEIEVPGAKLSMGTRKPKFKVK